MNSDRRATRESTQKVRRDWIRRYPRSHQKAHSWLERRTSYKIRNYSVISAFVDTEGHRKNYRRRSNSSRKGQTRFREQGITITAVLTAFGFIISIIIISVTGGAGAAGGYPNPPKHPNRLKEWLKNKLKALAKLLVTIAGKAAAALLGIIGTIIAGVLNFFKKVYTAFRMLSPIFSISCFVKPRLESMIHSDQLVCANSGLHKPTEIHVKRGNRCKNCTEPQQAASPHPNVL